MVLLEFMLGGASFAVLGWKLILNTNSYSTKADGVVALLGFSQWCIKSCYQACSPWGLSGLPVWMLPYGLWRQDWAFVLLLLQLSWWESQNDKDLCLSGAWTLLASMVWYYCFFSVIRTSYNDFMHFTCVTCWIQGMLCEFVRICQAYGFSMAFSFWNSEGQNKFCHEVSLPRTFSFPLWLLNPSWDEL